MFHPLFWKKLLKLNQKDITKSTQECFDHEYILFTVWEMPWLLYFLTTSIPFWHFQWFKDICCALWQPFCFYIQCQCVCECVCVCVCIWTETKWSKIILSLCCNCEINLHNNLFALLYTLCPPLLLSSPSHPHMQVERPVACNTSNIATCTYSTQKTRNC